MTFSVLNFDDNIRNKDRYTLQLFRFVDKHLSPVKKEIKYLVRNKKHGLAECRIEVRYYDIDNAIEYTKDLITNCGTRQKQYIPTWEVYLATLSSLQASFKN